MDEGSLANLPRDEYQMVLGYLSPKDKKNLKLASKACETRVMALDPTMRRWTVKFINSNENIQHNLEQCLDLIKARAKLLKIGIIDDIQLKLLFEDIPGKPANSLLGVCIAENVINKWKNNIVHLGMYLTGHELFLMDPALKLPRLRILKLKGKPDEIQTNSVASTLIENNAESLEVLYVDNVDFEIKQKMKLTKISACSNVSSTAIVSVLNSSKESLKSLCLMYINPELKFECPELNIRELDCVGVDLSQLCAITKSCQQSLETLQIKDLGISDEDDLEINALPSKLKNFRSQISSDEFAVLILKANCSTLEELYVEGQHWNNFDHDIPFLQKLIKFEADYIKGNFADCIIRSSTNTLREMSLCAIFEPENELEEVNAIPRVRMLKKLKLDNVYPQLAFLIIDSVRHSLEELEFQRILIISPDLIKGKEFPNLRKLKCDGISKANVFNFMFSAKSTLKDLSVISGSDISFDFDVENNVFNLERFYAQRTDEKFVFDVLKTTHRTLQELIVRDVYSSYRTLQELSIRDVYSSEQTYYYDFDLPEIKNIVASFCSNEMDDRLSFWSDLFNFINGQNVYLTILPLSND